MQTFWYLYPIIHSTPKLFTKKYPYPPEIHSISISIRVTHSMKGSRRTPPLPTHICRVVSNYATVADSAPASVVINIDRLDGLLYAIRNMVKGKILK